MSFQQVISVYLFMVTESVAIMVNATIISSNCNMLVLEQKEKTYMTTEDLICHSSDGLVFRLEFRSAGKQNTNARKYRKNK